VKSVEAPPWMQAAKRRRAPPLNEVRAKREAAQREREAGKRKKRARAELSEAGAQEIRRRWWASEAEVDQRADEYDQSSIYVELVLRRRLLDRRPFVPGERALDPDEKVATVRSVPRNRASYRS
jgi:hypothetical protein